MRTVCCGTPECPLILGSFANPPLQEGAKIQIQMIHLALTLALVISFWVQIQVLVVKIWKLFQSTSADWFGVQNENLVGHIHSWSEPIVLSIVLIHFACMNCVCVCVCESVSVGESTAVAAGGDTVWGGQKKKLNTYQ